MRTIIHLGCGEMSSSVRRFLENFYSPDGIDEATFINREPVAIMGDCKATRPGEGTAWEQVRIESQYDVAEYLLGQEFEENTVQVIPAMAGIFDLCALLALVEKFVKEFECQKEKVLALDIWIVPSHRPGKSPQQQPDKLIHLEGRSQLSDGRPIIQFVSID